MKFFLLVTYLIFTPIFGMEAPVSPVPEPIKYTVYLFLGEECIISQQYTLQLRELHKYYANEQVAFVGLFPNPSSKPDKIRQFKEQYKLNFDLRIDGMQQMMDRFNVQVTPEAVVWDHKKEKVLYQGRIDNMFFRVGKRRTVVTTSELKDVLAAIHRGANMEPTKTEAVGCFITPLDPKLKNVTMCNPGSVEER